MWNSARQVKFNFKSLLLVLTKLSLWQGDWALGYHYMKFRQFSDISKFPNILSLKSFGNSWGNSYIPCLWILIAHRFICTERRIWQNIERSQNIVKLIVWKIFFSFFLFLLTAKLIKTISFRLQFYLSF